MRTFSLIDSHERRLRAGNRSERTIRGYRETLTQAETFLAGRGKTLATATRGDLEAFLADLLSRGRAASTAATRHKHLRAFYRWLADEEEIVRERPRPCRR